jgi:hypothetical protein
MTHPAPIPPAWPALMDLATALAYCTLKEDAFRSVTGRQGVRPVDLGMSCVRYRRADLDAMLDKLTMRAPKLPDQPAEATGVVYELADPAAVALERARKRARHR